MNRKWMIRIFFISLAFLLLYYSFSQITKEDWQIIFNILQHINYWLFAAGILVITISHILRSQRWLILIDGGDGTLFSFRRSVNAFGALMIGYVANMIILRLGEVARCTTLSKYEKSSSMKLIGTIIVERAIDLVCLFIVFALTLYLEYAVLYDHIAILIRDYIDGIHIVWTLFILLAVIGVLFLIMRIVVKRFPIVWVWAKDIWKGIVSVRHLKRKWEFIIYTIAIWFAYTFCLWIGFRAFPETMNLSWGVALSIISVGSIAMVLTQGGIGAYQLMVMQMLALYGVSRPMGFTLGWLFWILMTLVSFILGGFFYLTLPYINKKR